MSVTFSDPLANIRLFEDAFTRMLSEPRTGRPWSPAVDIFETENELVLKADLPDVELKDIDVRIENQTLSLKGERRFEQEENTKGFHRIERQYEATVLTLDAVESFGVLFLLEAPLALQAESLVFDPH